MDYKEASTAKIKFVKLYMYVIFFNIYLIGDDERNSNQLETIQTLMLPTMFVLH